MKTPLAWCCATLFAMSLSAITAVHARSLFAAEPQATGTPAPRPFEELDTNADGAISKDEAAVDPALAQAFGTLDKDADGRLTPEEYALYVPLASP